MAAGLSRRMGRPKLLLPWGEKTVIETIATMLIEARIDPIIVVAGSNHESLRNLLSDLPVQLVVNPRFEEDSMAFSLQAGLARLPDAVEAAMVVLGDQPQIPMEVVRELAEVHNQTRASLVIPSHNRRRGHPWIIDRRLWGDVMFLTPAQTLRDFINAHAEEIHYVEVPFDSIFHDLDTPEDYTRLHPG